MCNTKTLIIKVIFCSFVCGCTILYIDLTKMVSNVVVCHKFSLVISWSTELSIYLSHYSYTHGNKFTLFTMIPERASSSPNKYNTIPTSLTHIQEEWMKTLHTNDCLMITLKSSSLLLLNTVEKRVISCTNWRQSKSITKGIIKKVINVQFMVLQFDSICYNI